MSKAIAFDVNTLKSRLLIYEGKRWLGFTEMEGNNEGQVVEAIQKAVDGKAQGEAWCMAFCQFCLKHVDRMIDELLQKNSGRHGLEVSEHCLTTWHKSPVANKSDIPKPGMLAIWQHGDTTSGHAGIVVEVETKAPYMWVIEGNTSNPKSTSQTARDGIYLKRRSIKGEGRMKIVGFLKPWV